MRNFSSRVGKIFALLFLVILFVLSMFAQPGPTGPGTANLRLREAVDTDHDGKADLTVFRPVDHNWFVLK
ncbi:MAG: hypothetical protein ACRD43_01580, partial [Pyrinomonadaceae bacterium]